MITFLIIVIALILDWLLGEPKRWHPLVGFGMLATRIESLCYGAANIRPWQRVLHGLLALIIAVVPIVLLILSLSGWPAINWLLEIVVLTLCIGHKSLHDHTRPIIEALNNNDETLARTLTGQIVSRDTATLNIEKATIESILENGSDAVFAALFWFLVAGAPGVICYRLVNTLDAMWGYRNQRYLYFGRAVARLDDVMNYVPARLCALSYALMGKLKTGLFCWKTQAQNWDSPNAGPVMASGAGALNIELGGSACYGGVWHNRPVLGCGTEPTVKDIARALQLVRHSLFLWLAFIALIAGVWHA